MFKRFINRLLGRPDPGADLHNWQVQYEAVFEHMPVGLAFLTRDMRYIRINPYLEKKLRLSSDQIAGKYCYDVVGMYKDDLTRKGVERICDVCGVKTAMETGKPYKFTRKTRPGLIVDNMGVPVFSASGEVIGAAEIIMDVTQRVAMEERLQEYANDLEKAVDEKTRELRKSRSFLDSIIQSSGDAIFTLDAGSRIKFMNAAAAQVIGRSASQLIDRPLVELMGVEDAEGVMEALSEAGRQGRTVFNTRVTVEADGGGRVLLMSVAPLMHQDGERLYVCICKDITKEAVLEKEKEEFLAMVTHDLKTPITSILGYSSLVLAGDLGEMSEDMKISVRGIRTNANKMMDLVGNFLSAGRMDDISAKSEKGPVSLSEKVSECIGSMRPLFDEKELLVTADIQEGLPHITGDTQEIERVVYNLMTNALKFTPKGGSINARVYREGDGHIALQVSDSGPGVDEEDIPHVFDKYYRGVKANGSAGTGLGLYITKSIVEAHDGEIELSSGGSGSTFTVRLPLDN